MSFEKSLWPGVLRTGLSGSLLLFPAGCDSNEQAGTPVQASTAPAPFDSEAGKNNLTLSNGTKPKCIDASFALKGGRIIIEVIISPPDLKGVTTRYQIYSTNKPFEGAFSGTTNTISADGLGMKGHATAEIELPLGSKVHTDPCSALLPIKGAD